MALGNRFRLKLRGHRYNGLSVAYFAAMSVQPSFAGKQLINTLIQSLQDAGVLSITDHIYLNAVGTQQAALLDIMNPAGTAASIVIPGVLTLTFVQGAGFMGATGASLPYIDTNQNRNAQKYYTQNSAWIGGYSFSNVGGTGSALIGCATSGVARIIPRNTSDQFAFDINDNSNLAVANTNGLGFFAANRSTSAARQGYIGNAQVAADTRASVALASGNFTLLRDGGTGSTRSIGYASFGGSRTAPQAALEANAVQTYMNAAATVVW